MRNIYLSPNIVLYKMSAQNMMMSSTLEIAVFNDPSDEEVDGSQVLARRNNFEWDDEEM